MIQFSKANAKLRKLAKAPTLRRWLAGKKRIYSFDLLSGHTCPAAKDCFSKVVYDWSRDQYKLVDGPDMEFRCFSASQEAVFNGPYNSRLGNWEAVADKTAPEIERLLLAAMPHDAGIVRIHVAGDFFNQQYFRAWMNVARKRPDVLFYAYTKMIPFMLRAEHLPNFVLTASRGGKYDSLIDQHGLREARVVYSKEEAKTLKLQIDNDDSHAADPRRRRLSFALLIHGQGASGSKQAAIFSATHKAKVS